MNKFVVVAMLVMLGVSTLAFADGSYQALPFSQDWSNTSMITVNDDWSGVPGIIGYRGDGLTGATGTDPQTLLLIDASPVVNVLANQTAATSTSGAVGEFELVDPVVASQGSGTADAPYLQLYLDTSGLINIVVSYNLRDIDATADNAVQQVAMHFRTSTSDPWTNVPAAYVADASDGPSLTKVTPVSVTLPAAAENIATLQVRIMTTNAVGSDEWLGVDDISVTGTAPVANENAGWSQIKSMFR